MSEHGYCPNCKISLDGGSIWQHFRDRGGSDEEADRLAVMYGATRTKGNWGRAIGIYSRYKDRTVKWKCPDCDHEWDR